VCYVQASGSSDEYGADETETHFGIFTRLLFSRGCDTNPIAVSPIGIPSNSVIESAAAMRIAFFPDWSAPPLFRYKANVFCPQRPFPLRVVDFSLLWFPRTALPLDESELDIKSTVAGRLGTHISGRRRYTIAIAPGGSRLAVAPWGRKLKRSLISDPNL
jgi:hypothetical protein